MATIYAHTQDGYVSRFNQSSWSNARVNSSGTAASALATTAFTSNGTLNSNANTEVADILVVGGGGGGSSE